MVIPLWSMGQWVCSGIRQLTVYHFPQKIILLLRTPAEGCWVNCIRFFDPIGFTSPFLLKGKLIYKECITLFPGLSWDAPLPPKILGKWKYFMNQLEGIRKLTIPRWCTGVNDSSDIELHVFCDASSQAYGAVAYIVTDNNPHNPSFLTAKSHVIPR